MNRDEIKKEIMDRFGKEIDDIFQKTGTSKIEISDQKPKSYLFKKYLGKIGKKFVYLYMIAMGVIIHVEAIMDLPETIDKAKARFPKEHKIALKISDEINHLFRHEQPSNSPSFKIVFKESWIEDRALYEEDAKKYQYHDFSSFASPGTILVDSDCTSTTIEDTFVPGNDKGKIS